MTKMDLLKLAFEKGYLEARQHERPLPIGFQTASALEHENKRLKEIIRILRDHGCYLNEIGGYLKEPYISAWMLGLQYQDLPS